MIQCKCCMHQVVEGSAMCDVCKFPLLASSGADMDAVSAQYRRQLLENCSIAVKIHYYEPDSSGKLVEQKSEYVTVSDALSLKYHDVKWLPDEYNPPEVNRDIELEVRIKNGRSTEDATLYAQLARPMTCARLGLFLDSGMRVQFVVGDKDDRVFSNSVSLI